MQPTLKPKIHRDYMHTIAKNIATGINSEEISKNRGGSRRLLAKLAGTLTLNLALDYQSIYPLLNAHVDENIRSSAEKLKTKVANLGNTAEIYIRKWESETSILNATEAFVTDTKELFFTLAQTIEETNNVMAPLTELPGQ
ncbi:MAG: hypothetical protein OEV59_02845 [Deltaproteobacteria bacterium]|nr:hypothetical protein [Deltaproteobacteria bacterium]